MSDRERDDVRYLPRGTLTRTRQQGFWSGVVLTLLVGVAALLMLGIVLLAVLRFGPGWGGGCCQTSCCQTACCAQPTCRVPQADRYLRPEVDLRGRPLDGGDRYAVPPGDRPHSSPYTPEADARTSSLVPPCGCQPPLPWWPGTPDHENATTVPEPGTLALVTIGALAAWRLT